MGLSKDEFEKLVVRGLGKLPRNISEKISNVAIIVEDESTRSYGKTATLGLYEGVPQTERGSHYSALPDKITIFKDPIEKISGGDKKRVEKIVEETVWHEVAHHFGMNEEMVRLEEKKRGYKF